MILVNGPGNAGELMSDLEVLGFNTISGSYAGMDITDIIRNDPDIIILDLRVLDFRALSSCKTFIREGNLPPEMAVMALVSTNSIRRIPLDYNFKEIITSPYELTELSYRLQRLIHQMNREPVEDTLCVGNLSISPSRYEVRLDGEPVPFSHKEYELFKFLATHPGHVFTRKELFVTIWGNNRLGESRTVDVHIRRIRIKIGDYEQTYIKTVRGVGYTFRFENN
jgi:two-component system alkaline phosphatase synthesis response regulator PhoP